MGHPNVLMVPLESVLVGRFVQSVLVGLGAAFLAVALWYVGFHLYVRYLVARQPGIGAVTGSAGPFRVVMLVAFFVAFLWNWRKTR